MLKPYNSINRRQVLSVSRIEMEHLLGELILNELIRMMNELFSLLFPFSFFFLFYFASFFLQLDSTGLNCCKNRQAFIYCCNQTNPNCLLYIFQSISVYDKKHVSPCRRSQQIENWFVFRCCVEAAHVNWPIIDRAVNKHRLTAYSFRNNGCVVPKALVCEGFKLIQLVGGIATVPSLSLTKPVDQQVVDSRFAVILWHSDGSEKKPIVFDGWKAMNFDSTATIFQTATKTWPASWQPPEANCKKIFKSKFISKQNMLLIWLSHCVAVVRLVSSWVF